MAAETDPILQLSSLVNSEDGMKQLFSPVEVNDIPDGKYVEPQYVIIQREEQLRAEEERKHQEQEEKRIKAEQRKAAKEEASRLSNAWHLVVDNYLSELDTAKFKSGITTVSVHYIKKTLTWRIWNALIMKDSLKEWMEVDASESMPDRIVTRSEMGDFIKKLNQYTSEQMKFGWIYNNETLKKELVDKGIIDNEDYLYVKWRAGKMLDTKNTSTKAQYQLIYDFTKNQATFDIKTGFFFNKKLIQVRYVKTPIKGRIWNAVMKTGLSKFDNVDSTKTMTPHDIKNFMELLNKIMSGIAVFDYIHDNESVNGAFEKLGHDRFGVYPSYCWTIFCFTVSISKYLYPRTIKNFTVFNYCRWWLLISELPIYCFYWCYFYL